MTKLFNNHNKIGLASRVILLGGLAVLISGCGIVPVRHVPKPGAISPAGLSSLRGTQPIDVKAGACSSEETSIGSAGVGKVVGRMSEWTEVIVGLVRTNLSVRGATLVSGSTKTITITLEKAEIGTVPMAGAKSKIALTATTAEGLNSTFEGSSFSMAPLGAVDGAVADAVKKLLQDPAVDAYLRK